MRTLCEFPIEVIVVDSLKQPSYQRIVEKFQQLMQLGFSQHAIPIQLKVDDRPVSKAFRWLRSFDN